MREFARLVMRGRRFDAENIPVASLSDLSLFEDIVIEIAKAIFLRENPTRQRVPKRFAQRLSLALQGVEDGSSKIPVLERTEPQEQLLPDAQDIFDRAFDLLIEGINQADDPLAGPMPPEVIPKFRGFGKSLQKSESIALHSPRGQSAIYTPEKRRLLLSQAGQSYTEPAIMLGRISILNADQHEFRIVSDDGTAVTAPYQPELAFHILQGALADPWQAGKLVRVEGELEFSHEGIPQRFESAEVVVVGEREWAEQRLDELAELDRGWLSDGAGLPITAEAMGTMRGFVQAFDEFGVEQPRMAPADEGGIDAEWSRGDLRISLEVEPEGSVYLLAFRHSTKVVLAEETFARDQTDTGAIARDIRGTLNRD